MQTRRSSHSSENLEDVLLTVGHSFHALTWQNAAWLADLGAYRAWSSAKSRFDGPLLRPSTLLRHRPYAPPRPSPPRHSRPEARPGPIRHAHRTGVGLFGPKPTRGADCQGCGLPDLGSDVRRRPLLSVVIVTRLVTRPPADQCAGRPISQTSSTPTVGALLLGVQRCSVTLAGYGVSSGTDARSRYANSQIATLRRGQVGDLYGWLENIYIHERNHESSKQRSIGRV